ncbi:hypothetical protein VTK73DRAFT_694 [Phialemonium thermophilum]|uniref:Zn(2)-C6 fungal-type domain-containing protein n=1 Tax=Phialemonium thermophilum TaxID=223376 RepID=A0ABR3VUI0_9PEZI
MARPKVPDDKRQRTARACNSCKRRKQKCNGLKPCNTCTKRDLACIYTSTASGDPKEQAGSPTKRRRVETTKDVTRETPATKTAPGEKAVVSSMADHPKTSKSSSRLQNTEPSVAKSETSIEAATLSATLALRNSEGGGWSPDGEGEDVASTKSDDEASVFPSTRMLQDSTGRLLYLGDSAALSYLQIIRMLVESAVGPSPFTEDPSRHRIVESTAPVPPNLLLNRNLLLPPDRETAVVLMDSFFTNTSGLIEVLDRNEFRISLEGCYTNPLGVGSCYLCLFYLVLAIGLVLALPGPGSREEVIVRRLRTDGVNWAELFYRHAKCLGDSVSGFEDADLWSVQALLLMSFYMLATSHRNAAYVYHGMAVRSAFALGLHREEASLKEIFGPTLTVRRNLWRTLFVLDRFLSASQGRPCAVAEDDCSDEALRAPVPTSSPLQSPWSSPRLPTLAEAADCHDIELVESVHSSGLDATVRSARIIGVVLKTIYARRKISTALAQEIADECKAWRQNLDLRLRWQQHGGDAGCRIPAAHGVAILHAHLMQCHAVVLLTRPFFLHMALKLQQESGPGDGWSARAGSKMDRFSQACVVASYHTVFMIQRAHSDRYLPQRNPFVLYFLLEASITVLTNEFVGLYNNEDKDAYTNCIDNALSVVRYCAEVDPQANRLLFVLTSFSDVVKRRKEASSSRLPPPPALATIATTPTDTYDPMDAILGLAPAAAAAQSTEEGRQDGDVSPPLSRPIPVILHESHATVARPSGDDETDQGQPPMGTGVTIGAEVRAPSNVTDESSLSSTTPLHHNFDALERLASSDAQVVPGGALVPRDGTSYHASSWGWAMALGGASPAGPPSTTHLAPPPPAPRSVSPGVLAIPSPQYAATVATVSPGLSHSSMHLLLPETTSSDGFVAYGGGTGVGSGGGSRAVRSTHDSTTTPSPQSSSAVLLRGQAPLYPRSSDFM